MKISNEKQVAKKKRIVLPFKITNFYGNHKPYTKSNPTQHFIFFGKI